MTIDSVFIPAPPRRTLEDEIAEWEEGHKRLNLHDAHVRASGHRNRYPGQLLDMTFYHQIYSVPLMSPRGPIDFSGVLGIPPKVEYGHAKDPIIRDDRQGD
jgi:hypothetical protein